MDSEVKSCVEICPVCKGTGVYKEYVNYGTSTGGYSEHTCQGCGGKGWITTVEKSNSQTNNYGGTYYWGNYDNTTKSIMISLDRYEDLIRKEFIADAILNSSNKEIDCELIRWLKNSYSNLNNVNLSDEQIQNFSKYSLDKDTIGKHIPCID